MKILAAFLFAMFVGSTWSQTSYSMTYELKLIDQTNGESETNSLVVLRKNGSYNITKNDGIYMEKIILDEDQKKAVEFVHFLEDEEESKEAVISLFEDSYMEEIEPYVDFLELFSTDPIPNELLKVTTETKTIQGLVCKKVLLYDDDGTTLVGNGYLVENRHFPIFDGGEFFSCNLGAFLEVNLQTDEFLLSAKCTNLSLTAPAASNFDMSIPEDYELLEFEEEDLQVEGDEGE